MATTMQVVCAWCKKDLGTKDGKGQAGITHGICNECAAREWRKHEKIRCEGNTEGNSLRYSHVAVV